MASAFTAGRSAIVTAKLKTNGVVRPIGSSAVVTAMLYTADGSTPISDQKILTSDAPGADWGGGVVVAQFSEADTSAVTPPAATVRFVVYESGASQSWCITVAIAESGMSRSLLFPVRVLAVNKLRRDRLMLLANSIMPDLKVSDDYLWEKLRAAEAHVGHALRVPLAPTHFFPRQPSDDQIAALPAGMPWGIDPAYDYDPGNYTGDKWGMISARQKPIQSIVGMKFVYPSLAQTIMDVPKDWLRYDGKYGQVQLVPTGTAYQTLLGGMFLSHFSGGRQLPFTLEMEYVAGLANVQRDYPDLLDAVQRLAVVKIVEDGFMPQSGSISADGLSQSLSVDTSKYHDAVDTILNGAAGSNGGLMARIHGIRMAVI
jgi:hypothetical protein